MKALIIVLILLVFPNIGFASNHSARLLLNHELNEDYDLGFEGDYRYDQTGLYYRHYGFSLNRKFANDWSVALANVFAFSYTNSDWVYENRPFLQVQKLVRDPYFVLGLRSRYEYRSFDNGRESMRHRGRVMLESTKEYLQIKPFVSNEFFYDIDQDRYGLNRFEIGGKVPVKENGFYSLYYRNDSVKSQSDWTYAYLFILEFGYQF